MPARWCADCGQLFTVTHPDQRRCPPHQAAYTQQREAGRTRATTTQRGLGHAHRQRAQRELGNAACCQCDGCGYCRTGCGQPFTKANPRTAQHTTPRSRGGQDSPFLAYCRRCNSSRGSR